MVLDSLCTFACENAASERVNFGLYRVYWGYAGALELGITADIMALAIFNKFLLLWDKGITWG